jgi:K+-sensing histidine kinase KdpD
MAKRNHLAEILLVLSFILIFASLIVARPSLPFLALLLIPIGLAAVLYDFIGGTLAALAAMISVALLAGLDPDAYRRAIMLREVWPFLVAFLVIGPVIGWLVARERERDHQLATTTRRLNAVQEIVQAINTSVDPQETLETVISGARRLVPFNRATIMLRTNNLLRIVATAEDDLEALSWLNQAYTLDKAAAGLAVEKRSAWSAGPKKWPPSAGWRLPWLMKSIIPCKPSPSISNSSPTNG